MADLSIPQHDDLYVVSDLHMGGTPGFQILKQGPRLGKLIRWVAQQRPGGRVGLVLNGDVIDSLAENINGYVAMDDAVAMIERIFGYENFAPVWDALADFVKQPGRSLVVVVGNHDIELALPPVQWAIRQRLAGNDDAANGRIFFSTTGAGYACLVRNARVFCTHGNEVDDWNLTDYEQLSALAAQLNNGTPPDPSKWEPNAGTRMVKDVMNEVKRKFAWIDLLKPETKAAVGVLAVLDPGQLSKLSRGMPIIWGKIKGDLKLRGWLSADESGVVDAQASEQVALQHLLGPNLLGGLQSSAPISASGDDLLRDAEARLRSPARRSPASPEGTLGWGQMAWDKVTGVDTQEALRRALMDWLQEDKTFDVSDRDSTFKAVSAKTGPSVDFLITGHTHLERAIEITSGRRFYYNCGTWIRLLRFPDTVLKDTQAFGEIYSVLVDGSMQAIDDATVPAAGGGRMPFVMDQTSAVRVASTNDGVVGNLLHVVDSGESVTLQPVANTEFRRR